MDEAVEAAGRQLEADADAALGAGLPAEVLLLDQQARRVAAGATREQPYGPPGAPSRRGPVRTGFSFTVGGLLAVLGAYGLVTVGHQLLLLLVSLFVAVGLDP
ncbi:MAG: hypothetical protein H7323_01200, partial [Frankiales bacterium]|nr:hypothetical protein [Frankiales bacterium]